MHIVGCGIDGDEAAMRQLRHHLLGNFLSQYQALRAAK